MEFLDTVIAGNTLRTWLIAVGTAAITHIGLRILRSLLVRQLGAFSGRTRTMVDDVIRDVVGGTRTYFMLAISIYAGIQVVALNAAAESAIRIILVVVVVIQAALWGEVVIASVIAKRFRSRDDDAATATTVNALGFVSRLVLWTLLLLLGLANLGIQIGPLLAGLGVGGVAVALAIQNILGDLFASLSIVLDKPFVDGDFIVVDDMSGTIERVGVKTTRVRSLSGEQLVFANSDLLTSRIRNYKRMVERRVEFRIGVTYQTKYEQLVAIPQVIRSIIEAQDATRFDRSHFAGYGDSALHIDTVYYVLDPDFTKHMDIQQSIHLEVYRRFAADGIDFAYPTRTVILERAGTEAGTS